MSEQKQPPALPTLTTYSKTKVDPETVKEVLASEEDSITAKDAGLEFDETQLKPTAENITEVQGKEETEIPEDHRDDRYGNGWEIIKHTGVATTAIWAVLSAGAAGAAAFFFAPGPSWILMAVFGFFAGAIGAVDAKTHLIKNVHTVITAAATVPLAVFVASQLGWWNLLGGAISAICLFGTLIALIIFVGFGSGGDLKFSPVPGFALGVINPFLAVLWFFIAMIVTMVILIVGKKKETAFGVGMVIAVPIAIVATYFCYQLVGLPYM